MMDSPESKPEPAQAASSDSASPANEWDFAELLPRTAPARKRLDRPRAGPASSGAEATAAEGAAQERLVQLEAELAELRSSLRDAQAREARLESRLAELETSQRANDELAQVIGRRRPPPAPPLGTEQGAVELNTASFEELREAGLSVTQAVRVLSRRDAVGGFDSVDELDELPGFSPEQRESLKSRARI